ncbi:MAG TPA: M13 family metallopeptidase [Planctomycetota bacterium]|jgi:putative endopeptidase|nr:M13 family metallopeptidase [Planctomycetota bacterium]
MNRLLPTSVVFFLSALLPACHTGASGTPTAPAAPDSTKPHLGTFGVDLAAMDRTVKPGDDFFRYVNGKWLKHTEIPADRSTSTSFSALDELAKTRERDLIDDVAAHPGDGDQRKIADYYRAFMDEAAIETKGLAPIQPELDAIAALQDKPSLARALGRTLRADVDLLNATVWHTDRLFGLWVSQHLQKPDNAPYLVQGGLSLPDRDFYLEAGRMADIRAQFEAHVAKVLELAHIPDSTAKAKRILALETAIARVHATGEDTNDVKKGANFWSRADFDSKAPGMDWAAYFDGASLAHQDEFIVWQPGAVSGIAQLVGSEALDTWKEYLAFHALDRHASLLPKAFADESFAFYGTTLSGTPKQQERWKRAVAAVDGALGEAVGKLYVARYFSKATKARAEAMVQNLLVAFGKRIDKVEWMTPATKARAKQKLAGMQIAVGYPERWRDYAALEVRADDALGNAERAGVFEYQRNLAKLGKPVDRGEWYLLAHEVNALNLPIENRLIFPAAILEPPFFDAQADDAVNYGAIGAVIGHEISHSYDSSGALFDEQGRLANWWTPEDFAHFEAAGDALAAQFDGYRPFPDLAVNGKLTLGENIADVAGLATAIDAYHIAQGSTPARTIDGFTPDQRLFLGFAQVWRSKMREKALRNLVATNVHAPGEYRAATVRNQDAWYAAFAVQPGQALYLAPEKRVKVW